MRLHIPDHLQKNFQSLMNLSYDLKKRHPGLKRNVKFDESELDLFMDLKTNEDAEWRRVSPAQAKNYTKTRSTTGARNLDDGEIRSLLGGEDDSE